MTDIVERLRHAAHDSSNTHLSCLEEAADTIEALQSALRSREAECERLRVALRPFAECGEVLSFNARFHKHDNTIVYTADGDRVAILTHGHFRRAESAIRTKGGG